MKMCPFADILADMAPLDCCWPIVPIAVEAVDRPIDSKLVGDLWEKHSGVIAEIAQVVVVEKRIVLV